MSLRLVLIPLSCLLISCAAAPEQNKVAQVATTPLTDLNLVHAPIPPALLKAQQQPYTPPSAPVCEQGAGELKVLDELLGPDLDAPASASNPGLVERGGELATSALQHTVEGAVPFRGWIRKLSGAERYSRQAAAAIAAGTIRRGFLKGFLNAKDCPLKVAGA